MANVPNILVFDSGIGGISVYNEVRQKISNANFLYFFDNQAFPYGDKSTRFLIKRVNNVINNIVNEYPIDLIIIACNTASTICLPTLRESLPIPVVGVVPAIKPATKITVNNCIGLLATRATIQRDYTHNLINEFARGYHIELLGLSELALIAEKKLQGIPVDMNVLQELMQPWLKLAIIPDTIVLGCTHYPFIQDELKIIFPHSTFIDSGYAVASRVYSLLMNNFDLSIKVEKTSHNLICSTQYNDQVGTLIERLKKYNFDRYQLIFIPSD